MSKLDRIHELKVLLRNGAWWTADALAEHLECSPKTATRGINYLRDTERWPIDSGKSGYRLREPSMAEAKVASFKDIAAVAMAQEALHLLGDSEIGLMLRAGLQHVCGTSSHLNDVKWSELRELVQRYTSGESPANESIYGQLTLASLQHMPVKIRYRRLEEEHDYPCNVFPHRLIHRDHCWYLIAHDLERGGQKTYSLPRISNVDPLPRHDDFKEPAFEDRYADAFGIWTAYRTDAPLQDVCVELTGYWARIAKEKSWHASQRIEELAPDLVRVHFRVNELVQVKTWVLGFGGAAKVIAPDELRELVCEEIEQMNHHYA